MIKRCGAGKFEELNNLFWKGPSVAASPYLVTVRYVSPDYIEKTHERKTQITGDIEIETKSDRERERCRERERQSERGREGERCRENGTDREGPL